MSNFSEEKVERAGDGKFAPKATSETEIDLDGVESFAPVVHKMKPVKSYEDMPEPLAQAWRNTAHNGMGLSGPNRMWVEPTGVKTTDAEGIYVVRVQPTHTNRPEFWPAEVNDGALTLHVGDDTPVRERTEKAATDKALAMGDPMTPVGLARRVRKSGSFTVHGSGDKITTVHKEGSDFVVQQGWETRGADGQIDGELEEIDRHPRADYALAHLRVAEEEEMNERYDDE